MLSLLVCGTDGECRQGLVGKLEGQIPLGRPEHTAVGNNINMYLKEVMYESVD
jgi:hypothetical protein